ncbi:stage II sporulation protein M [Paenibacillus senegalensis]|uniref:stage II sporulation protein M n=1 Tax=Paenibacillus senegalensis TaxID=1465766 RepID=UPI000288ADC7|nr:stage II sporulation protein M [Paenibacillus senegalensis]
MTIQRYIREHKPVWNELEQLLTLFEKNKNRLEAEHIDRLTYLYKLASSHLAYSQTYYANDEIVVYLNQLVSRTHHVLHAEQWKTSHRLGDFFGRRFIQFLVDRRYMILLAFALFMLGGISGFIAVYIDPLNLAAVTSPELASQIDPYRVGEGHDQLQNAVFSTNIMTNNIRVAILAFVSGITLGLMTVYVLFYNGLIIGALAAVFWQAGTSYVFWAYILPHGIIELAAIFIAGGAGLYLGYRMINPGAYTWKYRLLRTVRESAMLLIGTIPLFVIAAIIEGYVTPSTLPLAAKYTFALVTLLALVLYIAYGRMNQRRHDLNQAKQDQGRSRKSLLAARKPGMTRTST